MGMSRKDTIIIAALINAGLLAFLFASAINQYEVSFNDHFELKPPQTEQHLSRNLDYPQASGQSMDEVDLVLKNYSSHLDQPIEFASINAQISKEREKSTINSIVHVEKQDKEASQPFVEVTVKRGDFLAKIARANGTTVDEVIKLNQLTNADLQVGQVLKVPIPPHRRHLPQTKSSLAQNENSKNVKMASAHAHASSPPTSPVAFNEPQYYVIKSGDNPWKIARQHQVKFEELLKMNNLDEEKARNLKVGDRIRVR